MCAHAPRHRSGRVLRPLPGARPAPPARDPRPAPRPPTSLARGRRRRSGRRRSSRRRHGQPGATAAPCRDQRFLRRADRRAQLGVEHLRAEHVELGGEPDARPSVRSGRERGGARRRLFRRGEESLGLDHVRVLRGDAHHQRCPRASPLALSPGARAFGIRQPGSGLAPEAPQQRLGKAERDRGLAGRLALSEVGTDVTLTKVRVPTVRDFVRATPSVRLMPKIGSDAAPSCGETLSPTVTSRAGAGCRRPRSRPPEGADGDCWPTPRRRRPQRQR